MGYYLLRVSFRGFWAIAVSDLALADWYVDGFDLVPSLRLDAADGSRVAVLRGDDVLIELKQREQQVERAPAADGCFKIGWFVPSVAQAQERLGTIGAAVVVPQVDQPELGLRFCLVADPEGHLIQLFEDL